jgi:hypothetical protein
VFRSGVGVLLQAATGCLVTHNSITRFRYSGVSVGWTWVSPLSVATPRNRSWGPKISNAVSPCGKYFLGYENGSWGPES